MFLTLGKFWNLFAVKCSSEKLKWPHESLPTAWGLIRKNPSSIKQQFTICLSVPECQKVSGSRLRFAGGKAPWLPPLTVSDAAGHPGTQICSFLLVNFEQIRSSKICFLTSILFCRYKIFGLNPQAPELLGVYYLR